MIKKMLGIRSDRVKNKVERGMVKRFAEAIDDPHPIFVNEEFGLKSKYGQNIAPFTFPRVFDYGELKGLLLPRKGQIHGEQTYRYQRPLKVEETVYCYKEFVDCYEKKGMLFIVIKGYGETESEEEIFNFEQIIIITEAVRKENNL